MLDLLSSYNTLTCLLCLYSTAVVVLGGAIAPSAS